MSGVPGPIGRFVALFFAPIYLVLLAAVMHQATDCQMVVSTIFVFTGSVVVIAIIMVLSGRFADQETRKARFSISSLMMFTTVAAIYMAYIGQFVRELRVESVNVYGVTTFLYYALFFVVISTFVLIRFTDALLALANVFIRLFWPNW